MSFSRARYVVVCQQMLVAAAVLAVGLSAAGVMTLQIVAPEGASGSQQMQQTVPVPMRPAVRTSRVVPTRTGHTHAGLVDKAPVDPVVHEVKVSGIDASAAREIPGLVTAPSPTSERKAAPTKLAALSAPEKVHGYATVGVTWAHGTNLGEKQISVQVRTRTDGAWSGWTTAAYHDEHGPDPDSAEARKIRPGTDAVVVGDVDEVQMKAETADGKAPADLALAVVDPGTAKTSLAKPAIDTAKLPEPDGDQGTQPQAAAPSGETALAQSDLALQAMTVAPKPTIFSRAQWGADESLRDPSSLHYGTIKAGFIHHTVNANDYTRAQVPALIRGIYAYHVKSRGWSDIGYNFLVDRFGQIWEGRYGGVNRAVVGAHTLGYNDVSFAMSAIGNFDIARPPQAVVDAYARLFAWKLSLYDINAAATRIWLKDRYVQAINGHRDVGQTACPGRYLYARIPDVRTAARNIQLAAQQPVDPVDQPVIAAPSGVPSPTATPLAATAQPAMTFPARTSVGGNSWADVVTKRSSGAIRVVTTNGMMGFGTRTANRGAWADMNVIAAVGDVNGDGFGDVVARSTGSGYVHVFPGNGRGGIASRGTHGTLALKYSNMLVGAGDWNRDGRRDLLSRDARTSALYISLGHGDGTFGRLRLLRSAWPYVRTTAIGDFTGDGLTDLLALRSDGRVVLVPGKGGLMPSTALGSPTIIRGLGEVDGFAGWGDLTGDRRPDVVYRSGTDGLLYVLAGTGRGTVGTVMGPFATLPRLGQLTMAPTTGSAAADLVGRDARGNLVVIAHNGRTNLGSTLPGNLSVPGATQVLSVGDWDRDGHSDVITREFSGQRLVLRPGLGNGKFGRGRSLGNGWSTITRLAAVGDVTGDGYPDLMGRIGSGRMRIWPGAGRQAFKAVRYAPSTMRTYNQIGTGSWSTGTASGIYPSSNGTFVPNSGGTPLDSHRSYDDSPMTYDQLVGVGDVNGDGLADVLARQKDTGVLWLLPGKTSGGSGPPMWVAAGFSGYQVIG